MYLAFIFFSKKQYFISVKSVFFASWRCNINGSSDLYELLVAVLRRCPGIVVVVQACLPRQPAVVIEGRGRGDLIVADLPRLHAERRSAVERWCERERRVSDRLTLNRFNIKAANINSWGREIKDQQNG